MGKAFSNYKNYIISVNNTRMLTLITNDIFDKYPENLPANITRPIFEDIENIDQLMDYIKEGKLEKVKKWDFKSEITKYLLDNLIIEFSVKGKEADYKETENYSTILLSHELVMYIAHLEAFTNDAIRIICHLRPGIMTIPKKDKGEKDRSIEWNEILDFNNWDDLILDLIEKYIYSFGWKSSNERFKIMKEKFQIKLNIDTKQIKKYKEAEEIRHCIIHNGGKATQKFLDKTARKDVNVGESIPLSSIFNKDVFDITTKIAKVIFLQISSNFFKEEFTTAKMKNPMILNLFKKDIY